MRKVRFIILILIAGFIGYYLGVTKVSLAWNNYKPQISVSGKEPPANAQNIDMTMYWKVLDKLEENYYDKTVFDSQKILNGAITGMVESIGDPYTVYLPPQQNTNFKQGMAGQFEGIGAELGMKDKQIIVVSPLDGSPAQKAGVRTGDIIYKVEGNQTSGWTLAQAVEKIRGPKGTKVALTLVRIAEGKEAAEKPIEVSIIRDTITVKSVTTWTKPIGEIDGISKTGKLKSSKNKRVAYIRLSQFGDNTNNEWLAITNKIALEKESLAGVVLDLRNNPGGYLTDAVFIASEFITKGTVVIQDNGKDTPIKMDVEDSRKGLLTSVPIVVLINKGSASASEIVSGALRDHKRAKLVGETSFGKGTIQEADDMGQGAGLHVTIAKWLTPNGTWIHMKGLQPDVVVTLDEKDPSHDTQLEKGIETLLK